MLRALETAKALWRGRSRLDDLVGINRRNVDLVYGNNLRRDYPLVDDKIACKEALEAAGVPVAPTLAICDGLYDVDRVVELLSARGSFVVKPASSSGGEGIVVLAERARGGWWTAGGRFYREDDLREHLANIVFGTFSKGMEDCALVEERIVQHPVLAEIYPRGLSDIRLLLLRGTLLMSMIRIPTERSGARANLHQGGVGVAIDIETGVTTRAVLRGEPITTHPDTGAPLIGVVMPNWGDVVSIGARAAATVPLGYLGIDVVLDAEHGPLVLEMNARPGLEIQNVNGRLLGELVREVES
jgi:alpha-L-glutamate ligase-like protein